ncbi:hypothetical protein CAPTEDRAFT_30497, partial [Capitella teleta]
SLPMQHAPWIVPEALKPKVKDKLDSMEARGVIQKVEEPTDWISSMVVVEK